MYKINNISVNVPPGSIAAWPSNIIPSGWAICDGSAYDSTLYPNLHIALGSPSVQNLPNLNAAYLRGTGTNGTYTGPNLRSFANDKLKGHSHTISNNSHAHDYFNATWQAETTNDGFPRIGIFGTLFDTSGAISGISLQNTGSVETRPYTYVINWIIKLG